MGGSSKSSHAGWRYFFGIHMGIGRGPLDAFHEIRVGDRRAWIGNVASNQTIQISAPNLFGGEDKEGGIEGPLEILMGEPDQVASTGLLAMLGGPLPGFRGMATAFFNGLISMNNPYPKPWKFRISRIFKGWDGEVFAPDYAAIGGIGGGGPPSGVLAVASLRESLSLDGQNPALVDWRLAVDGAAGEVVDPSFSNGIYISAYADWFPTVLYFDDNPTNPGASEELAELNRYRTIVGQVQAAGWEGGMPDGPGGMRPSGGFITLEFFVGRESLDFPGSTIWEYGRLVRVWNPATVESEWYAHLSPNNGWNAGEMISTTIPLPDLGQGFDFEFRWSRTTGKNSIWVDGVMIEEGNIGNGAAIKAVGFRSYVSGRTADTAYSAIRIRDLSISGVGVPSSESGMNGAHIIYEALTNREWGRGLSRERLDENSFLVAAQTLYNEEFPLCMKWTRQDSLENFVQGVLDHIGAVLYEHRGTGLLVLKLLRDDYLSGPEIPAYDNESGLLEIREGTVGSPGRGVNTVSVTWHDPMEDQPRTVTVRNNAAIRMAGGAVNSTEKTYSGLPTAALALRIAQRDLRASSTNLRKYTVVLDGYSSINAIGAHPGDVIRVKDDVRAIPWTILRIGSVEYGTPTDSKIVMECIQDVFSMPATSFATDVPSSWTPPDTTPCVPQQKVFEVPYFLLAGRMSASDLAYVTPEGGFMGAVSAKGKATNAGIQLAVRNSLSTSDDTPPNNSYMCEI